MKKVLITGADSYIGTSLERWALSRYPADISVETVDMRDGRWREKSFGSYDCVFHVAGIAHVDTGNPSEETKARYFAVNRDLAVETARKAKREGVKHFIFMSSITIYGDSAPAGSKKIIYRDTVPSPETVYADSKWQADQALQQIADERFTVAVLRPPMIYGKGCKGNFPMLAALAKRTPVFPLVKNQRSMLYIDNLTEFVCQIILRNRGGVYWPQNAEYSNTSEIVREIAAGSGKRILLVKGLNWAVKLISRWPGKPGNIMKKVFGNLTVEPALSVYDFDYQIVDWKTSVLRSCGEEE